MIALIATPTAASSCVSRVMYVPATDTQETIATVPTSPPQDEPTARIGDDRRVAGATATGAALCVGTDSRPCNSKGCAAIVPASNHPVFEGGGPSAGHRCRAACLPPQRTQALSTVIEAAHRSFRLSRM